jgi:rod shape determining protein RodA
LHLDFPLLLLLLALTGVGLVVLYSANGKNLAMLHRQMTFFALAYVAMFIIAQINMHSWRRWAPWLFVAGILLLIAVPIVGSGAKGAQRWLDLPGLPRFQPSELMKLLVPLMLASYLANRHLPPTSKHLFFSVVFIGIPTGLILIQPDLGTAILIASSGLFVLFFAGVSLRITLWAIGASLALAPLAWFYLLHDYQKQRILTLLNPEKDKLGAGWNIIQSKTAIGSGGLSGKGWLNGTQSHLDFLPESHTDFIIAVLAEEFGLVGVLVLLSLYLLLIGRCLYISLVAKDTFSRLVTGSVTLTFFVYVFVNMGMVSGLLPVVGVPLPLVSQGGTSLFTLLGGFGFIMAVATKQRQFTH